MRRRLIVAAVLAGCAPLPPTAPAREPPIAIVAAERGPDGVRLVAIDERGDRGRAVVAPAAALARDTHPVVSPDRRWLVFASSRERPFDQTSLWIAPLGGEAAPRRLTAGPAIDAHPSWRPDGSAIVFSSTRGGGGLHLWELAVADGAPGALRQLTAGDGHEITPSVTADGAIVYAALTADPATRTVRSRLAERAGDGAIRALTDGPGDASPAVSPDGARIAFARPRAHDGQLDGELWWMPRAGGAAELVVELPLTDESGPVWSRDGRYVFATSVLRGAGGRVLFSSVIYVDVRAAPRVARMLEDRVGAIVRLTPALTGAPLDAAALAAGRPYLPELAAIVARALAAQPAAEPTP